MSSSLVDRFKERKLVQWALAYLAAAWVLFEVADVVGGRLGWPDAVYRQLLVVLMTGFLIVLVLAWYHGEKGEQAVRVPEILMLVGIVALGVGALASYRTDRPEEGTDGLVVRSPGSVAVLAFADMSAAGDQAFLAEGMSEEISSVLSHVPGLRVAARTSAFSFQGGSTDVRSIGDRLDVRHVLEGSVRHDGQRVRISVKLVDTSDGFEVWSRSLTRELTDVIRLQEEVAALVVSELRPQLTDLPIRTARTSDPDAHLHYLRGRYHWHRMNAEAAVASFEEAIVLDSTFAGAWAGLGSSLTVLAITTGDPETRTRAMAAVDRATALDRDLPDALAAKARSDLTFRYDWLAAEEALRRAVVLDPNHVETRHWYSHVLAWTGRTREAVEQARAAVALDPLSPFMGLNLGNALHAAGSSEEALQQIEATLELEPTFALAWLWLWESRLAAGMLEGAAEALARWAGLSGGSAEGAQEVSRRISAYRSSGRRPGIPPGMGEELPLSAEWLRRVYSELGEDDLVLDSLWQAYEAHSGAYDVLSIKLSGRYQRLRDNPRFEELVARIGPS